MNQAKGMTDYTDEAYIIIDIDTDLVEATLVDASEFGTAEFLQRAQPTGWRTGIVEATTNDDQVVYICTWTGHERFKGMSLDAIAAMVKYEFNHFILTEIAIEANASKEA